MHVLAPAPDPAPASPALDPHPALLVSSSFDDTAVRRACLRGDLVRLVAGRYVRRRHWSALDPTARHVMFVLAAVSCLETPVVVSHASAAAFWGFPRLGPWPLRAHVLDPRLSRTTALRHVHKHAGQLDDRDVVSLHGTPVTSAARTTVDLALSCSPRQSVMALDHGLRHSLFTAAELESVLAARPSARGRVRALESIRFADRRADGAGESLSRVVMSEAGLLAPDLQHCFPNPIGRDAYVDFSWKRFGVVGEFDGETKYRDSKRWSGLSPEDVVIRAFSPDSSRMPA